MGERARHGATRWWSIEVSPMSDDQITAAQAESSPSLLRAKAAPLIKSAEWRHKANQILWSLMSPVIPGMVFIIHWFDHRMNLHKNKAWWIHYLMIPVVMITALILIIRWDETWSDGNTTPRDGISQSEGSMAVTDQSEAGAWSPQFTSVWGPFTDNEPCPASVPWPALLSPDSNWFVYHDVDHCVPSLLEISGHQTPAAWSLIIIPGLSSSCGGSTPDSTPGTSFHYKDTDTSLCQANYILQWFIWQVVKLALC